MKRILFLLIGIAMFFKIDAEDIHGSKIDLSIGLSGGALLHGKQYDLLHDGLTPQPTQYTNVTPEAGVTFFFSNNLGAEISTDFFRIVVVTVKPSSLGNSQSSLYCYSLNTASVGVVYRMNIQSTNIFLIGGLGLNGGLLSYSSDFKALFPSGFQLYDISPGIGGYAKVGIKVYMNGGLFLSGEMRYDYLHTRIEKSNTNFDGGYLNAVCLIGLYFK